MFRWFWDRFSDDIGIDLGTANSLIYVKGKGIVLREPSVVALDVPTKTALAVGNEAKNMIGKTPGRIIAVRPLKDGVIADWELTEIMLRAFIQKAIQKKFIFPLKHRVVIGIPSGTTAVEQRAVLDAAYKTAAREAFLVEEPMAAAIGANIPIGEASGNIIVDIGGGTTEVAVISLGGIVISKSIRIAGDELDHAIMDYVRRKYNLLIGERSAERVKIEIGSAYPSSEVLTYEMRGMDQVTGLPRVVPITSDEVREAMQEKIAEILKVIREALEETPPELAADIIQNGITLVGGGALLRDFDIFVSKDTGIATRLADDPLSCVVLGTKAVLEDMEGYKGVLVGTR